MARKQRGRQKVTRNKVSSSARNNKTIVSLSRLPRRSSEARENALHVLAALRRDPSLSPTHAARLQGVKLQTIKRYFPSALKKSKGRLRVTASDHFSTTLFVPDAHGNPVPVNTRSSKERQQLSQYLHDLGRYLRGNRNALSAWHGKQIAGIELVTAGRTIKAIEPALSEFSL